MVSMVTLSCNGHQHPWLCGRAVRCLTVPLVVQLLGAVGGAVGGAVWRCCLAVLLAVLLLVMMFWYQVIEKVSD